MPDNFVLNDKHYKVYLVGHQLFICINAVELLFLDKMKLFITSVNL